MGAGMHFDPAEAEAHGAGEAPRGLAARGADGGCPRPRNWGGDPLLG